MSSSVKSFLLIICFIFNILLLTGCEDTSFQKQQKQLAKSSSFKYFQKKVIPILEKSCAISCHGVQVDSYRKFMNEELTGGFHFPISASTKKIPDEIESQILSFQAAIGKGPFFDKAIQVAFERNPYEKKLDPRRINYEEEPEFSHLLRVPLAEEVGGLPHRGKDIFYSMDDEDYKIMYKWILLEQDRFPQKHKEQPTEIAFFRDNVQGILVRKGCFLTSCHGPNAFNDLKLTPPLPLADKGLRISEGFSTEMTLQNRDAILGLALGATNFTKFDGDLKKSRFIVKNLPINEGGIHQRGGNNQFFETLEEESVQIILEWLGLERRALAAKLRSRDMPVLEKDLGKVQGVLFIRGPRHSPRQFFDLETFWAGSDIFLLKLSSGETLTNTKNEAINLTRDFFGKQKEIHSLDVSYDGKSIVFAMRKSKSTGFRLYQMELDENLNIKSVQQISFADNKLKDGTIVHHIDPLYSPIATDLHGYNLDKVAIVYTSNSAGAYVASDVWGILGKANSGDLNMIIDIQRTEAPGTFLGRKIYIVDGPNKGEWRKIIAHLSNDGLGMGSKLILDRALPYKVDLHTSYEIEKLIAKNLPAYSLWRFVPLKEKSPKDTFIRTNRRMTFTNAQVRRPTMRGTGEVMMTSVRNLGYQGGRSVFNGAIYRIQNGGFDYHIHGGNRSRYSIFSDARELPSGLEVRIASDPRNYWGGGELFLSDHGLGVNAEPNNPVDKVPFTKIEENVNFTSAPRFIYSQLPFFPEVGKKGITHTGISPGGSYRDPYPMPDGKILVSRVIKTLDHLNSNEDPHWQIYLMEFEKNLQSENAQKIGKVNMTKIEGASSELADYFPRPIMIRLKEKAHPHQKFSAEATANNKVIDDFGILRMPKNTQASVECFNYTILQSFLVNFSPIGARNFHLSPEEGEKYKYVRVIMQNHPSKKDLQLLHFKEKNADPFATPVSKGIHTKKSIIAEVPIEEDGSFFIEVPPNVPLIIQGLDRHKRALHSMNRWFYLQDGERLTFSIPPTVFQMRCGGCHGALTGEVKDAIGPLDLTTGASKVMANWNDKESIRRKPYGYRQKEYISIDYLKDVQPIFNKKCVSCHGSDFRKSSLNLTDTATLHYNVSYESLHQLKVPASGNHADKKYINEREALSSDSRLIRYLMKKEHPTKINNPLTKEELLTLIRWIDLGATFKGGNIIK